MTYIKGKRLVDYIYERKDYYAQATYSYLTHSENTQYNPYGIYDIVSVDTKDFLITTYSGGVGTQPGFVHMVDLFAVQAFSPNPIPMSFINELVNKYK